MSNAWPALAARSAWLPGLAARWSAAPAHAAAAAGLPPAWQQLLADPGLSVQAHWASAFNADTGAADTMGADGSAAGAHGSAAGWRPLAPRARAAGAAGSLAQVAAGVAAGAAAGVGGERPPAPSPVAGTGSALQWLAAAGSVAAPVEGSATDRRAPTPGRHMATGPGRPTDAGLGRLSSADAQRSAWHAETTPSAALRSARTGVTGPVLAAQAGGHRGAVHSAPAPATPLARGVSGAAAMPGQPADGTVSGATADTPSALPPTRLVQGSGGLGRLLALVPQVQREPAAAAGPVPQPVPHAPAALPMLPPAPAAAPLPGMAAPVASTPPAARPALSAADTDTLLQALVDRLQVDYLRHYGSAG